MLSLDNVQKVTFIVSVFYSYESICLNERIDSESGSERSMRPNVKW